MKFQFFRTMLVVPFVTTLAATGPRASDAAIENVPTDKMAWEVTEEGVGFAPLIGERFNEACMA